jgi:hypothetical protein
MSDTTLPRPDQVLSTRDPGDETARRFRFQWTYAAITCCGLLDDTQDLSEVFCEHHEDVLIKHNDGTFSGLQVKTREQDQPPWKTADDGVKGACVRFAQLEMMFPGAFRAFRFLTNHSLHSAENSTSLSFVLKTVKGVADPADLPLPVLKFLQRIAKECNCSGDTVFASMRKAAAFDNLPKLQDIELRLVDSISDVWSHGGECTHVAIVNCARQLVFECSRASSLAHLDTLPAYVSVIANPEETEMTNRIAAKRFDGLKVKNVLEKGLSVAAPLDGDPNEFTEPGTGAIDLLRGKLDAGGFSTVSRNSAIDLRDKADYLGIVWTKKYGRMAGLQRYGHIRSLVLSDAAKAFEASKLPDHPFGLTMLNSLRTNIAERRQNGSQLYDCTNEHLEGFAYSLTSECKVQWSLKLPWDEEV